VSTPRVTVSLEPESAAIVIAAPDNPITLFCQTPTVELNVQVIFPAVSVSPLLGLVGKSICDT
jgi:hypothetical protein